MEQLEKWTDALDQYIKHLDIPLEEMSEYKESRTFYVFLNFIECLYLLSMKLCSSVIRQFGEYVDPDTLLRNSGAVEGSGAASAVKSAGSTAAPRPAATPAAASGTALHPATAALLGLSAKPTAPTPNFSEEEAAAMAEAEAETRPPSSATVVPQLSIAPGALVSNLGIPLVVVVTKVGFPNNLFWHQRIVSLFYFLSTSFCQYLSFWHIGCIPMI